MVMAVGRNMGMLHVWQSTKGMRVSDVQAAACGGTCTALTCAHGTLPVSAVSLKAAACEGCEGKADTQLRLVSSGMDGSIKSWLCGLEQVRPCAIMHERNSACLRLAVTDTE